MITREQFEKFAFSCTWEEHLMCDCTECSEDNCKHRLAFRRRPEADGGLALCPRLQEYYKEIRKEGEK